MANSISTARIPIPLLVEAAQEKEQAWSVHGGVVVRARVPEDVESAHAALVLDGTLTQ